MTDISPSQYGTLARRLKQYIKFYGGWSAIFSSPFFWLAFFICMINYTMWDSEAWLPLAQSLLPNLLGFSLGTYAILFSIINNRLKRALREVPNSRGIPYLFEMNATFFHFLITQVVALIWTFIYTGTLWFDILTYAKLEPEVLVQVLFALKMSGGFIGMLLLVYSTTLIIAAAMVVYRLAMIKEPN
ncbi:hypothetical protein [Sphingorhabdus sp. 109]|jgi:hypothetical protein|uniref:hypothetical protein n=1 Tax=Sphingorhabdus sp. 109 TaxID=2653173 RepID=UPI0012F3F457|nr:hypothetical protein [Sphingorhabdus sp. 109]VWX59616.1 conserved membrane hypothetical protein [Sphingorhabdus sp. 109]